LSIAVVGVGNILFKDEGIGIYAAKYLEENYDFSEEITVIDGGTLGFKLMTYYSEYDQVLILDTVSIKDTPGSVYNLPAVELLGLGSYRQTAHEVEVVEMLEICSMLDRMAEVTLIGMIPEDIQSVEIDLSASLRDNFELFIGEVLKTIEKAGVKATKKAEATPLDTIIHAYANPTAVC